MPVTMCCWGTEFGNAYKLLETPILARNPSLEKSMIWCSLLCMSVTCCWWTEFGNHRNC